MRLIVYSYGRNEGPQPDHIDVEVSALQFKDPGGKKWRAHCGRHPELLRRTVTNKLADGLPPRVRKLVEACREEQLHSEVHVGIRCSKGRHRSVALAEALVNSAEKHGWTARAVHLNRRTHCRCTACEWTDQAAKEAVAATLAHAYLRFRS